MSHSFLEEEMEERAALYALGALTQHEARVFDEHLAQGCEACAADLKDFEAVVETLAHGAPVAVPPAATREKLMARLKRETENTPGTPGAEGLPDEPLVVRADEGEWQQMCAGIVFKQLFTDPTRETVTTLIRMEAGARMPMHRHHGIEECYVIEGDVFTNNQNLKAGDYTCAMAGSIHHPISSVNGALLLIVAPESFEVLEPHAPQ